MTSRSVPSSTSAERTITETYRAEWGRLLSVLVVRTRRLDLAEDALAQAFASASERWPLDGAPTNPSAWLYTAAHRAIIGRLRAEAIAGRRAPLLAVRADVEDATETRTDELPDDQLQLVLLCCHPALDPAARSALALRLVIGTPTDEIARLFLVQPSTMAARLTRAKHKIGAAGIPLSMPIGDELASRLDAVVRTVYLAFTAGYSPGSGQNLLRVDQAGDAVRLAALLHRLVPDAHQVTALLALVQLQHARRDARVVDGRLVTLAQQDRRAWHRDEIEAACALLDRLGPTDGYAEQLRLEALAAREHAIAHVPSATDWRTIAAIYADLERRTGSPVVRLNRTIAIAEVHGAAVGLALLDDVADALADHHRYHATRADLARRMGRPDIARSALRRAIELCRNDTERAFLEEQLHRSVDEDQHAVRDVAQKRPSGPTAGT